MDLASSCAVTGNNDVQRIQFDSNTNQIRLKVDYLNINRCLTVTQIHQAELMDITNLGEDRPRGYLRACKQDSNGKATVGQHFERFYPDGMDENDIGSFQLRDPNLDLCIMSLNKEPRLSPCDKTGLDPYYLFKDWNNVNMKNVGSNWCFDINDGLNLLSYPCYEEGVNPKQNFRTISSGNVVADFVNVEAKEIGFCIDFVGVGVYADVGFAEDCNEDTAFEKVLVEVPLERELYDRDMELHKFDQQ